LSERGSRSNPSFRVSGTARPGRDLPGLSIASLAQVYDVLAFYLSHQADVEVYLREQAQASEVVRQELQTRHAAFLSNLRKRLATRRSLRHLTRDPGSLPFRRKLQRPDHSRHSPPVLQLGHHHRSRGRTGSADDSTILARAAERGLIVVSHDARTMIAHATAKLW